jgi:hypothetical protein
MAIGYQKQLAGIANPNYRGCGWHMCQQCNEPFHSYQKNRKFCSVRCRDDLVKRERPALAPDRRAVYVARTREHVVKYGVRKDANHRAIVDALRRLGVPFIDMSKLGNGVPDGAVLVKGVTYLVEFKNPQSQYGKKGLSPAQRKWADEWQGGDVYIVQSLDDVLALARGQLSALRVYRCGYSQSIGLQ